MNKFLSLVGVLLCLGLAFYYDSSTASLTNEFRASILYTPEEMETVSMQDEVRIEEETDETDQTEGIIPTFEYLLEKTEELDGYVVETYREYEFYRNDNGQLLKKIPTKHLDFIRYKKTEAKPFVR
ncbi:hypothetical protein [Pseudoneobacillus sp. C159]